MLFERARIQDHDQQLSLTQSTNAVSGLSPNEKTDAPDFIRCPGTCEGIIDAAVQENVDSYNAGGGSVSTSQVAALSALLLVTVVVGE